MSRFLLNWGPRAKIGHRKNPGLHHTHSHRRACLHPAPPPSFSSHSFSPMQPPVFGWLLHSTIPMGGCPRPQWSHVHFLLHSKWYLTLLYPPSPHLLLRPFTPPLSNLLSVTADFHFIVAGVTSGICRHISPPPYLCFATNMTTNRSTATPNSRRLIWTNRKPRHHDSLAPLACPWRGEKRHHV